MQKSREEIADVLSNKSLTVVQKYAAIYGETVSRDKARYRLNKLIKKYLSNSSSTETCSKNRTKVEINTDGSQTSEITTDTVVGDLKDSKYLLELHGYDPTKFTLVKSTSSQWESGDRVLYSSKIIVKPVAIEQSLTQLIDETVAKYTKNIEEEIFELDLGEDPNKDLSEERLLEICLPDLHFGCISEDPFMVELDRKLFKVKKQLVDVIKETKPTKVIVALLGDIFHYDNAQKTTTSGTPQCSNAPFQEVYDNAIGRLVDLIYTIKSQGGFKIEVIYVPGNHDSILGYTIVQTLKALYNQYSDRVSFNTQQIQRKVVVFGKNIIGYTHGDMPKQKIKQWIYTEAKEWVSQSDNIEIHAGHYHCENTIEDNGLIVRYLPTLCDKSSWEDKQGYYSKRKVECFVWDYYNLEKIIYLNV